MKTLLVLLLLFLAACSLKHDRFVREASAFPSGYTGKWQAVARMAGPQIFQAGLTIQVSGDSLLWQYFSQIVDTTTNKKTPCGPAMDFMPVGWDDSLHVIRTDHGVTQGYGYDNLKLISSDQLQMNSFSLAPGCRGPFGLNATELTFSRVTTFRYIP